MTVGSLFSGIGGLDLGLEWAGFETKWFCEIEKFPQAVLRKHWPDVPIIEDVRDVIAGNVQRVDVIAGGFPCQDISWAGKGRGIDYDLSEQEGTRSGLWWEMWRVIRDLRPRYVIAENVPALTHRGLDIVLGSLAEIGYDAEWQTISAAAVGAPHIRERVFIVAYPNSVRLEGLNNDSERGSEAGKKCNRLNYVELGINHTDNTGLGLSFWDGYAHGNVGVGYGIPNRVRLDRDNRQRKGRLKAAGNAVVPQVGYLVGRAVMEHAEETS